MKADLLICVTILLRFLQSTIYVSAGSASDEFNLRNYNGVIIVFLCDSKEPSGSQLVELKNDYKQFIINDLKSDITHEYDELFIGIAMAFNNLRAVSETVSGFILTDILNPSDMDIYNGLVNMLKGYRKQQLDLLGITLDILLDGAISINGNGNGNGIGLV